MAQLCQRRIRCGKGRALEARLSGATGKFVALYVPFNSHASSKLRCLTGVLFAGFARLLPSNQEDRGGVEKPGVVGPYHHAEWKGVREPDAGMFGLGGRSCCLLPHQTGGRHAWNMEEMWRDHMDNSPDHFSMFCTHRAIPMCTTSLLPSCAHAGMHLGACLPNSMCGNPDDA